MKLYSGIDLRKNISVRSKKNISVKEYKKEYKCQV